MIAEEDVHNCNIRVFRVLSIRERTIHRSSKYSLYFMMVHPDCHNRYVLVYGYEMNRSVKRSFETKKNRNMDSRTFRTGITEIHKRVGSSVKFLNSM